MAGTPERNRPVVKTADANSANRWSHVLNEHQRAVVIAATARLIPGPDDDPAEIGRPGAREADVIGYIDGLLDAFEVAPPRVFAGGPFSGRRGGDAAMADFIELDEIELAGWTARISALREQYVTGIQTLDRAAGGDFSAASTHDQDAILATDPGGFTTVLMEHAIEGMYSNPEYGGNADLVGWQSIGFGGDTQPSGFTSDDVSQAGSPDPIERTEAVELLLSLFGYRAAAEG